MGTGLNIWVAKPGNPCQVDDKAWRITVYDDNYQTYHWAGISYADLPAPHAHWAGAIPPGTYVVRAVNQNTGVRTDHAIAVVTCEGVACVRLYVAAQGRTEPQPTRCEIKIANVAGLTEGDIPVAILVNGTAVKCNKIEVIVSCHSGRTQTTVVNVEPGGGWTAQLKTESLECRCGRRVKVIARCVEDQNCVDKFETDRLRCHPSDR